MLQKLNRTRPQPALNTHAHCAVGRGPYFPASTRQAHGACDFLVPEYAEIGNAADLEGFLAAYRMVRAKGESI